MSKGDTEVCPEDALRRAITDGLMAYCRFRSGGLPFSEYVGRYGSFFYEWDLGGEEGGERWKATLSSYVEAIEFLEQVQRLFNLLYMSDVPVPAYEEAGRLNTGRASKALMQLGVETDVDGLLLRLSHASGDDG